MLNMDPYFLRPEVSFSMLKELKMKMAGWSYAPSENAFAFGTLLDAIITEPDRIDFLRKTLDGEVVDGFEAALKMRKAFLADPFCRAVIQNAEFQKVSTGKRPFNFEGVEFELDCRCKWDWFGTIPGDLKSTAATSEKQFYTACEHFDYFASRAWYMDLGQTDNDILIGISKINFKIFKIKIKRGDELYLRGKKQYESMAFKYWALCS